MNNIVESKRTIYTPSEFAKESLIYLQEIGQTKALIKHTSSRSKLDSYLFFIVLDGTGFLTYNGINYQLEKGSCVFIDCNSKYSHTSDNWTIEWIHFNGQSMQNIYNKYIDRNGLNIFKSKQFNIYKQLIDDIQNTTNLNDYLSDMNISLEISNLLTQIMKETVLESNKERNTYDISAIKKYIDDNYLKKTSLDDISNIFYINKYYLIRLFKNTYGVTINRYILEKRITKAKELLRFSDLNIKDISIKCGIQDSNYFSRLFKQIEDESPNKYRNKW